MGIMIDGPADPKMPKYDPRIKCPDHPNAHPMASYGLAGGGIGAYTFCAFCTRVLSKTQDEEDKEPSDGSDSDSV